MTLGFVAHHRYLSGEWRRDGRQDKREKVSRLFPFRLFLKKCEKKIGSRLVCVRKGFPLLKGGECAVASRRVEMPGGMGKW